MKLKCEDDKLARSKHLEPLTTLIENVSDESFVMTVSAPYGGGKTFFINLWQNYLRDNGYKTLYYNAWENDVADNPLMSFIACFDELKLDKKSRKELIKSAASVFADEVLLNPKVMENCFECISPNLGILAYIMSFLGKKIKKVTSKIKYRAECENIFIEQVKIEKKKKEQIVKLKTALKKIIDKQKNKKLIIFIDDLDRCSPSYAIKFLEYIKHLFDVEGCIFVLAVDEEQLRSAIEVVYGNKNGEDFLAKIIDYRFKLPIPNIHAFVDYLIDREKWGKFFMESPNYSKNEKIEKFTQIFNIISQIFKLSLRDVLHISQDINIVFKSHSQIEISPIYVLLVYVIENYQYKIEKEIQGYIKNNLEYIKAFRTFCSQHHYNLRLPKSNKVNRATLQNYLAVLDFTEDDNKKDVQNESYLDLSAVDYQEMNYKNVYENTKKIIEDVVCLDKEEKIKRQNHLHYFTESYLTRTAFR
ncbi:MAG: P-loop NTPase fold protein [Alphaproteobacteria bacterium]